ncbi:hypothetical protein [Halodesulfovibrio marinisediminis]|uniref:Uncharacterized protein n=1 Tax=Halodesulfovibrio marinisediminis DSM 17456 TaxID=1121457 RepID=A0A1N6I1X4_9BACT|nr:hypothetical protein [Halodesulfovibrio marinisediminis]SIO26036.1 hypothetical protein SAMN02745161_2351 [Halodesulfovibrio marinisediminis DSM 17456]
MEQYTLIETKPDEPIYGEIFLTFSGEATIDHALDTRLYAQSLLGFHKSFEKINKTLLNLDLSIEIVGESEGSFIAKIKYAGKVGTVVLGLWASSVGLADHYGVDIDSIASAPFVFLKEAIESIKDSKGNNAELERLINTSNLPDNINKKLLNLLHNKDLRIAFDDFTLILETHGIDELGISSNGMQTTITKNERPYFKAQPEDTQEVETIEDTISIVSISKTDTWKFRGTKIAREFSAEIMDKNFLETIRLHPASKIFKMNFSASIIKTSVTKANKRKPDPPTYTISNFHEIPLQESIALLQEQAS